MFETAELGRKLSRAAYKQQAVRLRTELVDLQLQLRQAPFSVILVFAGVDGAGKSETANLLHSWLDPRGIVTRAFAPPSEEERERPEFWRYWLGLPPRGSIGIYLSAWYSRPLLEQVYHQNKVAEFDQRLNRIATFERSLAQDGTLILKFWMHLGKRAQRKRLRDLERDTMTRWRVTDLEKKHLKLYDVFEKASDRLLHKTSTAEAPWHLIEGEDSNYRAIAIAELLRDGILRHLERHRSAASSLAAAEPEVAPIDKRPTVLSTLNLDHRLAKAKYRMQLERYQGRLNRLSRRIKEAKRSTILVFEGVDAAGKGGSIRRLIAALDAPDYQVISIAAPTDEEQARHYLWRFWRHLPRSGQLTIFDRSWYGRVLVERIEGFASDSEWKRAYSEINDFEEQLTQHGMVLCKFWIHIDPDEQLRRFETRQNTPYKSYKITDEDWRNRERWPAYETAVDDMVAQTSTSFAPWTLVEGNNKRYARIKVLKTLCHRLEQALKEKG